MTPLANRLLRNAERHHGRAGLSDRWTMTKARLTAGKTASLPTAQVYRFLAGITRLSSASLKPRL